MKYLEVDDLEIRVNLASDAQIAAKFEEALSVFKIRADSPSDPLAKKPKPEELTRTCRTIAGLDRLVEDFDLHRPTYYHRGVFVEARVRNGPVTILGLT